MTDRQLKVLVADDVRLSLEIERTLFQRDGFKVVTAPDGPTALALAVSELPDVIVLDEVMPGLRGTEVAMRLKSREGTRAIPIVIVSSNDTPEVREASREAGAEAFVPKDAGREHLLQIIAQILHIADRKSPRLSVYIAMEGIFGDSETHGKALGISEGGMCLEVNRRYEVGTLRRLRFTLPGEEEEIEAPVRICWINRRSTGNYLLGLEFTGLDELLRRRLQKYMDRSFSWL